MGYSTDFRGELILSKPLTKEQFDYINTFSETRRMKRDVNKLMKIYQGKYGYPGTSKETNTREEIYGNEGEYFVGGGGHAGQNHDETIIDFNTPAGQLSIDGITNFTERWEENKNRIKNGLCQPGLWCQWIIQEKDGEMILLWDGGEKFYYYIEWLKYLINHFFSKWDILLNGEIEWRGEDFDDDGIIKVNNNVVTIE